jgi:hypothetical protein
MIYKLKKPFLPYTILSNRVLQRLNNSDALAIWVYLQSMPPDWVVRREQIMDQFGLGRQRFDKARRQLEEAGLWVVEIERDKGGCISNRLITIMPETPQDGLIHKMDKPTLKENRPHTKETLRTKETTTKEETEFDLFWSAYPRKAGKPAALRAFRRVSSHLDDMLKDLKTRFKQTDKQFIPYPATYLNQRRWEDELETETTNDDDMIGVI